MVTDLSTRDPKLSALLRPQLISEFIGQPKAVEILTAMTKRGKLSDSVLFIGGPGLGKTTLAQLTTFEKIHTMIGGNIQRPKDAVRLIQRCHDGDVAFIDEIHSAKLEALEALYSAMEDGYTQGAFSRVETADLQIVAATTQPGKLPRPFIDRFGQVIYLDYYEEEEIERIVRRSARILKTSIPPHLVDDIARRSRGTPRIANRLLRRAIDFSSSTSSISAQTLHRLWKATELDSIGLEPADRRYLSLLAKARRPVGVRTAARQLGLDNTTLETVMEPHLLRKGLIDIGTGGRSLTTQGAIHLAEEAQA